MTTRRRELEVDCNWKLFLEVFNESYHLEHVHAATFGGIYLEPELPDEVADCVHSSFSPTAGTGGLKADEQEHALPAMPDLGARERAGTRYTWVFPSLTFAAGSEALWAYCARPMGPRRCRVTQWVCFPPRTVARAGFEAKAQRYCTRMDEALAEDIAVLERQQLGMESSFARAGALVGSGARGRRLRGVVRAAPDAGLNGAAAGRPPGLAARHEEGASPPHPVRRSRSWHTFLRRKTRRRPGASHDGLLPAAREVCSGFDERRWCSVRRIGCSLPPGCSRRSAGACTTTSSASASTTSCCCSSCPTT